MKPNRILSVLLSVVVVITAMPVVFTAGAIDVAAPGAVSFAIEADGNTFTITRSCPGGILPAQTVQVRTVDVTALAGVHYTGVNQTLSFSQGEPSRVIGVSERTSSQIPDGADRYQTGTTREYRLEVLDMAGFLLASRRRQITYSGAYTYNGAWIMEHDGIDLMYVSESNDFLSTYSSITVYSENDQYLDVSFPDTGSYTTISDQSDNGYTQGVWTVSTDALYERSGSPSRAYFADAGDKMYAAVAFLGREVNDGYQYIQILADNSLTCDDKDGDGAVGTVSRSVYKACFELRAGSTVVDETNGMVFPLRYDYATKEAAQAAGVTNHQMKHASRLYQQKFKNESYRAANAGALVLSPTVGSLSVRFNARGSGSDDWKFKDMFARLAIVDQQAPYVTHCVVSPGTYHKHNRITVTLRFNEIVKTTDNNTVLHTTWGDLKAEKLTGTTYANAIAFTGEITATSGKLIITGLDGTICDLHGLTMGTLPESSLTTVSIGALSAPAYSDGAFQLTSASDLYWYADYVGLEANKSASARLANDIDMIVSHTSTFTPLCPNYAFWGTFDGAGHTLRNLTVAQAGCVNYGLFSRIGSTGRVCDLTLDDGCEMHYETVDTSIGYIDIGGYYGAIAGTNDGTIERCSYAGTLSSVGGKKDGCYSFAGGLVGLNLGTVRACRFGANNLNGFRLSNSWTHMYLGGLVGWNTGRIEDSCFFALYTDGLDDPITDRGAICAHNSGVVVNCAGLRRNTNYFGDVVGTVEETGSQTDTLFADSDAFATGEVCYTLNKGVTDGTQTWYQTIGTDLCPVLAGGTVYLHGTCYQNSDDHTLIHVSSQASTTSEHGHIEYWYCSVCGAYFADANGTQPLDPDDIVLPLKVVDFSQATLQGHALCLDGSVGVIFYMDLPGEIKYSNTAYMEFTVTTGDAVSTQRVYVTFHGDGFENAKTVKINDKTYYAFTCHVSAKEMTSVIRAQMFDGLSSSEVYTHRVVDYAQYVLDHPEVEAYSEAADLVKAMLNYGAAAQSYFGVDTEHPANAILDEADRVLAPVPDNESDRFYCEERMADNVCTVERVSLSIQSEITFSCYLRPERENLSIFVYSSQNKSEQEQVGAYQVYRVRNIPVGTLERTVMLQYVDGTELKNVDGKASILGFTVYSPRTYVVDALKAYAGNAGLSRLLTALYWYDTVAHSYMND